MPKFFWLIIATGALGERYGWWQAALGVAAAEMAGSYLTGMWEAYKADRAKEQQ